MKWKSDKYFKWGTTAFLVIASSICLYYLIFHGVNVKKGLQLLNNIFMPVLMGLVTAYLLTPALNFVERRILVPLADTLKLKDTKKRSRILRGLGVLITAFLFFLIIYGIISMLLSQIIPSIQSIIYNFDNYINNFTTWLNEELLANNPEIKDYVLRMIDRYSTELEGWMNGVLLPSSSALIRTVSMSVISTLKQLWNFIIGFIISIYVLASKEKFAGQAKKIAYAIFERNTANTVIHNFRFTHQTFSGFVSGKILDSIIIGILCFIGTSIMQTPYAMLISLVIGVTNIIPFFGPFLGAIPTGILVFLVDLSNPLTCVYYLLFILFLQQVDGNLIGPKILGNSTGIAGFWVIFSITLFGGLFGILGMIVGVPIFAIIYAAVKSLVNSALRKKDLPEETEPYLKVGSIDEDGFHEYKPDTKRTIWQLLNKKTITANIKNKNEEPDDTDTDTNTNTNNDN